MPRRPQVRYFASRGAYYTQMNGTQHKLAVGPDDFPDGPTYKAAIKAFSQLHERASLPQTRDATPVRAILEAYLTQASEDVSGNTVDIRLQGLKPFAARCGGVRCQDLSSEHLKDFIEYMRSARPDPRFEGKTVSWNPTTVGMFLKSLKRAFNWAVEEKFLDRNPVARYKPPTGRSRAVRSVVSPADHQRVLTYLGRKPLAEIIVALEATGARPGELMAATAADWNEQLGALVYHADDARREDSYRHKNAGRGKARVIRFRGDVLLMMRRLVGARPTGPLFRNGAGTAWNRGSLGEAFRRVRKVLGIKGYMPYSYRHTFDTRWLESGESIELLAEFVGTTPEVLRKHYRHITPLSGSVEAAFQRVVGGGK